MDINILEEELIKKVQGRIAELKNVEFKPSDRYLRVKEILSKYNLFDYSNFHDANIGEIIEAFILSNTDIEFESIKDDVEASTEFLDAIGYEEFDNLLEKFAESLRLFYVKDRDNTTLRRVFRELQKNLYDCDIPVKYVKQYASFLHVFEEVHLDRAGVNIFEEVDSISRAKGQNSIKSLIGLCLIYKLVDVFYNKYDEIINDDVIKLFIGNISLNGETKRNTINQYVRDTIDNKIIGDALNSMVKYCDDCVTWQRKRSKKNSKKIYHYEEFIKVFNSLSMSGRVKKLDYLLDRLDDEYLRVDFLKYIYQSTLESNVAIAEEYRKLVPKDIAQYHSILQKNGINIQPDDIEALDFSTPEELATSITILRQMGVKQDDIINVLEISSSASIKTLKALYDRKIIDSSLVNDNPAIFDSNGTGYKNILENIDLFTRYNINPLYLANHPNILLAGTSQLLPVVESLQAHEYLQQISRTTNINFIGDPNIPRTLEIIDKLDEGAVVLEDIDLLNVEQEKWKRVAILKGIGNAPTPDELRTVLTDRQFFIPDILIDDYLPITVLTKEDFTEKAKAPQRILTSPINL